MNEYLVVGVYADDHERFATSVLALDTDQAEAKARSEATGELIVAAIIQGKDLKVVA